MSRRSVLVSSVAAILLLSACGSGGDAAADSTVSTAPGSDILTRELSPDLTPNGVLLAAVILVGGDIEEALVAGRVTVPEVEAARAAIAEGTLDLWRQRAESGN
ncbi:MAG: hypothetical protein RL330_1346 [Actinomycetota bacterium]